MPDARKQVDELLKSHGAMLKRSAKHEVWQLPNGQSFTRAKTPSDTHSDKNNLSDLKRALGINSQGFQDGERRERKIKHEAQPIQARAIGATVNGALQEKLLTSGIVANSLAGEVKYLKGEIRKSVDERAKLKALVAGNSAANRRRKLALKRMAHQCWWCKVRRMARKFRAMMWGI